ncbi:MAG TPA: hypothetical protein VFX83_08315 [Azonexus sp.]|nr:hypothetical protein [Azonexus sp.]
MQHEIGSSGPAALRCRRAGSEQDGGDQKKNQLWGQAIHGLEVREHCIEDDRDFRTATTVAGLKQIKEKLINYSGAVGGTHQQAAQGDRHAGAESDALRQCRHENQRCQGEAGADEQSRELIAFFLVNLQIAVVHVVSPFLSEPDLSNRIIPNSDSRKKMPVAIATNCRSRLSGGHLHSG